MRPDLQQLAAELLVTSARFTRMAARHACPQVPAALWRTLAQLDERGSLSVSELATAENVSQPTATALVRRLAERGWVQRTSAKGDARVSMIRISPEGSAVLRQQRATAAEGLVPVLAEIDDETLHDLAAGLAGLRLAMRQDVDASADVRALGHLARQPRAS